MREDGLAEFVRTVDEIYTEWDCSARTTGLWFRGQAAKWPLLPSLYRGFVAPDRERELLRDFKLRATAFARPPGNDLEWLFIMRHHGAPTRLLDWSESYMTALYFAVTGGPSDAADACVWVLDPWSLNEDTLGMQAVPTADDDTLQRYVLMDDNEIMRRAVLPEWPAAVRPVHATPRIVAQRGCFTIHGGQRIGLEYVGNTIKDNHGWTDMRVARIDIPGYMKRKLRKRLHIAGTSAASLFPDLDGLATEITYRYSNDFMGAKLGEPNPFPRVVTGEYYLNVRSEAIAEESTAGDVVPDPVNKSFHINWQQDLRAELERDES